MNINGFAIEALNGDAQWHKPGALEHFPERKATRVTSGYRSLFVYHAGDNLRVHGGNCPHQRRHGAGLVVGSHASGGDIFRTEEDHGHSSVCKYPPSGAELPPNGGRRK